MMKPKTVLKKWRALCDKVKPKSPGKRAARAHAKMCGMKSMLEVECAADMDEKGIKWGYEVEKLEYQHEPQYYEPDFTLVNNKDVLIEVKGKMTADTRKKLRSIKRCNPDRRVCIAFGRSENKLSARPNSLRYWQWAEREGFEWSDKFVKKEWLS